MYTIVLGRGVATELAVSRNSVPKPVPDDATYSANPQEIVAMPKPKGARSSGSTMQSNGNYRSQRDCPGIPLLGSRFRPLSRPKVRAAAARALDHERG